MWRERNEVILLGNCNCLLLVVMFVYVFQLNFRDFIIALYYIVILLFPRFLLLIPLSLYLYLSFVFRLLQLSLLFRRIVGRSKYGKIRDLEIIPMPTGRWLDPFLAIKEPIEGISEYVKRSIPEAQESFRKAFNLPKTLGTYKF